MSDTTTIWIPALSRGDWVLSGADLQTGRDLASAVLISIFTDRIANADDEIPDGGSDPRGWVGDAGEKYPIGSRLWLLSREKQTAETQARAQDYLTECVQWLIDDGVVASFDIETAWVAPSTLGGRVIANQRDGSTVIMNFDAFWQGLR